MSDSKINIKIGHVEFSGEGNAEWLDSQLDKILEKIPELLEVRLPGPRNNGNGEEGGETGQSGGSPVTGKTLASWLKSKQATSNQNRKFLATAAFIQLGGKERLTTNEVTTTLKKNNQGKLGNPSDALNKNVGRGLCEKDGKTFYVTQEGLEELGINVG